MISGSIITIEDALSTLIRRSAEKISLDQTDASNYGDLLDFKATNIQGAFEEIESSPLAIARKRNICVKVYNIKYRNKDCDDKRNIKK